MFFADAEQLCLWILERIRPIDQKLKYQVDKLVKTATHGTMDADDPLRFRANPAALEAESDDESTGSIEKGSEGKATKVYRPPKLAPVHYNEDETEKERKERLLERAKRKALCTSVMEELRSEFYDGPVEIKLKCCEQPRRFDWHQNDLMAITELEKMEDGSLVVSAREMATCLMTPMDLVLTEPALTMRLLMSTTAATKLLGPERDASTKSVLSLLLLS
ncbi:hypothetical protein HPB50_025743 [Hyalomma asiaticum]|uniref:Uncharacterized protein n=1 Tax=Hyalomma asiaticum TaxID=266040 RepID=A0ACB7TTB1_HYAAI|nr:hypothetical protein HPB50_025743 [Hyalomma asiaticum]